MIRLPLMSSDILVERLTSAINVAHHGRRIDACDIELTYIRLFGKAAPAGWSSELGLAPATTVRDLYRSAVDSEDFRLACGRISASSAW